MVIVKFKNFGYYTILKVLTLVILQINRRQVQVAVGSGGKRFDRLKPDYFSSCAL